MNIEGIELPEGVDPNCVVSVRVSDDGRSVTIEEVLSLPPRFAGVQIVSGGYVPAPDEQKLTYSTGGPAGIIARRRNVTRVWSRTGAEAWCVVSP